MACLQCDTESELAPRDPPPTALTQTPVRESGADLALSPLEALSSALVPAISFLLMPTPSVLGGSLHDGELHDSPSYRHDGPSHRCDSPSHCHTGMTARHASQSCDEVSHCHTSMTGRHLSMTLCHTLDLILTVDHAVVCSAPTALLTHCWGHSHMTVTSQGSCSKFLSFTVSLIP